MRSSLLLLLAMQVSIIAAAQQIVRAEYFIGNDPGPGNGIPITIAADNSVLITSSVTTSVLSVGFNTIAIRTKSSGGLWSNTSKRSFYVEASSNGGSLIFHEIIAAEYFVDNDPGIGAGTPFDISQGSTVTLIDSLMADLSTGVHKLSVRTQSTSGLWSSTSSRIFIVKAGGIANFFEIVAAEYFIDTDPGEGMGIPIVIEPGLSVIAEGSITTDNLTAGTHTMGIRFKGNTGIWCVPETAEFTISQSTPFTYSVLVGSPSCFDSNDGFIELTVNSNPDQFTYNWNGQNGSSTLSNLPSGEFTLLVTDIAGENVLDTLFSLTSPLPITIDGVVQDVLCAGESSGSIEALASGGTAPFVYDWSATNPNALQAGEYSVTVTDANGCQQSASFTVDEPDALALSIVNTTSVTDEQNCNGSIEIAASGGTPGYSVLWNDPQGQTNFIANNLCVGSYEALVIDNNGCESTISADLILSALVEHASSEAITVYAAPNPSKDSPALMFTTTQSSWVTLEIVDETGRLVAQEKNVFIPAGRSQRVLDTTAMSSGSYVVRIVNAEFMENIRLTILR